MSYGSITRVIWEMENGFACGVEEQGARNPATSASGKHLQTPNFPSWPQQQTARCQPSLKTQQPTAPRTFVHWHRQSSEQMF